MLHLALWAVLQGGGGTVPVQGRVFRVADGDTVAVAATMVLLHRVGAETQGVFDSVRTDAAGRYRLQAPLDSGVVWLVSARHQGLEYFAPPVDTAFAAAGGSVDIEVADIDPNAPIGIVSRHLIVGGPAADGTRDVVDLVVLRNASGRTRAMSDSTIPSWQLALPPFAANIQLGDADFTPDRFDLHGDTLFLHAPVPPGDRQFFLQYQIAPSSRRFAIPLDQPVETLTLLAEEAALEVGPPLTRTDEREMDGRRFIRWVGAFEGPEMVMELVLPGGGEAPSWALPALIGVFALLLIGVAIRVALPRRG
jgi:hypothetical protein